MNHNKNRFPANDDYVNATMPIFHLLVPTVISIHFSKLLTEGLPSNERMCKWSFLLKGHIRIANPRIVFTYNNLARMTSNSLVIDSQIYCPKTRSVFMISYNNKPSLLCHFTTRGRLSICKLRKVFAGGSWEHLNIMKLIRNFITM